MDGLRYSVLPFRHISQLAYSIYMTLRGRSREHYTFVAPNIVQSNVGTSRRHHYAQVHYSSAE
jgi:hypothetical protein